MSDAVRVKLVENEVEAEVACGLLRSDGIECGYRHPDIAADAFWAWRELTVHPDDLARARELLDVPEGEESRPPTAA